MEYEYNGEKFIVSKPEQCTMKVTKDDCTATISVSDRSHKFRVDIDDGQIANAFDDEEQALRHACSRISMKLRAAPKDILCARLDNLYDRVTKGAA